MPLISDAALEDLPGVLAIFNDVIAHTTAVYREQPVTPRGADVVAQVAPGAGVSGAGGQRRQRRPGLRLLR